MAPSEIHCPKCGSTNLTTWSIKHPIILHWVLNPGLAINELVLGQRIPSVTYVCRDCPGTLEQRYFVACASCKGCFPATLWQGKAILGNWLGVVCPGCGSNYPSLWNITSLLILAVTFPIWYFPVKMYRSRIHDWQYKRIRRAYEKLQSTKA